MADEIQIETPLESQCNENYPSEEQAAVEEGDPKVPDWAEYEAEEHDEDPAFDEYELLKSRSYQYNKKKTIPTTMDYEAFYRQIEDLRSQISDQNRRIVELECSVGRVGVAFSHMSNLHTVFQGKNLTVTGTNRERRVDTGSDNNENSRPYFGNRGHGGSRNGRQRGGRNVGRDLRS